MIAMGRPQPDARTIVEPEPTAFGLLARNHQALRTPDSLDSLVIHLPPFVVKHARDPRRTVSSIQGGQFDDPLRQRFLVVTNLGKITLGSAWLSEYPASPPLGDADAIHGLLDREALPLRAQKFGLAASRRIALSSSASARRRLSRAFSFSSSLSRLA
jgi:hypothetical protein